MDNGPKKNQEKDQGEQGPANYFTGFFQIRRLDWLKYKKRAGSSRQNQNIDLNIREIIFSEFNQIVATARTDSFFCGYGQPVPETMSVPGP